MCLKVKCCDENWCLQDDLRTEMYFLMSHYQINYINSC